MIENRRFVLALGLSPIWLVGLLAVLTFVSGPGFAGRPIEASAAQILAGQRAQFVVLALAGLLMVAGTVSLYRARSQRAVLASLFLFTLPALVLVVFAPGLALILSR